MKRWYLVQTKPGGEPTALRNLARQGYDVYYPRLVEGVVRGGRVRKRVGALFPRYMFVRVSEGEQALAPINSSQGVSSIVRFGSKYALVPDHVIADLHARADPATGWHRLLRDELSQGMPVRVIGGTFAGLEGIFERQLGADRVTVLLTVLGQSSSVHLSSEYVVRRHAS